MAFIRVDHPTLEGYAKTALTGTASAGATTLTVENISGFSSSDYILIDGYESSKSEIVQLSGAPSGTTLTLSAALNHSHSTSATVQYIQFNQIEIEYSTDLETNFTSGAYTTLSAAADASTWTTLDTLDINPVAPWTTYNDTSAASRSYRTRFVNESTAQYSPYSDAILPGGFEEFSVGAIIRKALGRTNQEVSPDENALINYEFLFDEISNCLREVHSERKRWSWNSEFNYILSEITAGKQQYILPNNIDYTYSNRSMFNVRVENGENLTYIDKRELDMEMQDVHSSQLAAELNTGSTTAVFDDTSNFEDDGSFIVITGSTKDTVEYTANNRTTNTLTLATATGVTVTHAVDTYVWQNADFSTSPGYYTIFENNLYLYPVPDTGLYQRTIEIDYYKKLTVVDSVNDYVLFPDPSLVLYYLCMAISIRQRNYEDIDRYRVLYQDRLAKLIRNEVTGQKRYFTLKLNTGGY